MIKQCAQCGKTFETEDYRRKYCSKECAYDAHLENVRDYYNGTNNSPEINSCTRTDCKYHSNRRRNGCHLLEPIYKDCSKCPFYK